LHVADVGFDRAPDADIIGFARQQGRVIVTLDADFHSLPAISGATSPSVIRVRQEGLRGPEVAVLIQHILTTVGAQSEQGAIVTVIASAIRLRLLPRARASSGTHHRSA
jgi:predicted nuclease of predicted toxin-antitoxin system